MVGGRIRFASVISAFSFFFWGGIWGALVGGTKTVLETYFLPHDRLSEICVTLFLTRWNFCALPHVSDTGSLEVAGLVMNASTNAIQRFPESFQYNN